MILCQSETVDVRDNVSGEDFKEILVVQVVTYETLFMQISAKNWALRIMAMFSGVLLTGETLRRNYLLNGWKQCVLY